MGLQTRNYWKSFIIFYTAVFFLTNTIFVIFGKLIVGGWFFSNSNIPMLVFLSYPAGAVHRLGSEPGWPRSSAE